MEHNVFDIGFPNCEWLYTELFCADQQQSFQVR